MSGFILLHASLWKSADFAAEPFSEREAFMWLVSHAAWKGHERRVGTHVVHVERGQVAHTTRGLAKVWDWSESRVRRFLKRLSERRTLVTESDAHATRITICKYEEFQSLKNESDAVSTHPETHINNTGINNTRNTPPLPPKSKPKRNPVSAQLPSDWTLPDNSRAYAAEQGLDDAEIDRIRDDFSDYHRSKGSRFKDWHSAWSRWVRNEIKWAAERRSKARPGKGSSGRSSGGAYVDAYQRVYGSGDDGGSDRGPDDGAVAPMGGDVPDPGQPAKSEGGVVIELFRGKGSADVRGHDDPAQVQQRRSGQGGPEVEGDCLQAVAVPGSGGWFGSGGMGGERGVAPGMVRSEAASGQSLQDPSGIDFSNGASE